MLIFEGGGVVEVVGSPRKRARMLVFEGGGGRGGQRATIPENERVCTFSKVEVVSAAAAAADSGGHPHWQQQQPSLSTRHA